jgi:hypothetical protein
MSAVTAKELSGRNHGTGRLSRGKVFDHLVGAADFCRRFLFYSQWHLVCATRSGNAADPLRAEHFWHIEPPTGYSHADPFLFSDGGKTYLFFEIYSRATHGVIAYCEILGAGSCSEPRVVLEAEYHMSYPFVFRWGEDIYLIPETQENRTIELYRAVSFPDRWMLERVLMHDVDFADSTPYFDSGLCWLFTGRKGAGAKAISELHLFMAKSPLGPWQSHPQNPVVVGEHCARPAGRLFRMGEHLVRPGQDSSRLYGEAMWLNRVDVLSPSEYRESPLLRLDARSLPASCRTHTLNFNEQFHVQDGLRYIPRFSWARAVLPHIPLDAKPRPYEA